MSRKTAIRSLATVAVMLGGIASFSITNSSDATAVDACPIEIVDEANMYYETMPQVQRAVDALEAEGADVRIRTINGFAPFPSLDSYLENMRGICRGNWSNNDGTLMKGNLVVLGISFSANDSQRAVMLYYGSDWHKPLRDNGDAKRIETSIIIPRLQEGDYAGATIAGLEAVGEEINAYLHPQSNEGTTVNEAPDLSGLWTVMKWLLIFAAVVVGGWVAYRLYKAWRIRKNERQKARGEALRSRDYALNAIDSLYSSPRVEQRAAWVATLAEGEPSTAEQANQAKVNCDQALANADKQTQYVLTNYGDLSIQKFSTEQYQLIANEYEVALGYAQEAEKYDAEINQLQAELQLKLTAIPRLSGELQDGMASLKRDVQAFAAEGYRAEDLTTELTSFEARANEAIDAPRTVFQYVEVKSALGGLEMLRTLADETIREARTCTQQAKDLPETLALARTYLPKARESFARISSEYAEDSWVSIAGNGTEAEKRFAEADALIAQVQAAASMEAQNWDEASMLITEVNSLVRDGSDLLRAITERESHLARAKETAQAEVDAAQRDIDAAADFEQQHDGDIRDSVRDDIASAREILEQARDELARPMPNYLRVVDLALEANKAADDAYALCASDHEAAERLRHQAQSSLQVTEASIAKAERFIRNHSSDMKHSARSELARAKELLDSAHYHRVGSVERFIEIVDEAHETARSAFKKAERDFRDAEDERAREKRREEERRRSSSSSTYVGVYGGSWGSSSSSSSWDSGSGSSSSFGGFSGSDGGSGSSSSW